MALTRILPVNVDLPPPWLKHRRRNSLLIPVQKPARCKCMARSCLPLTSHFNVSVDGFNARILEKSTVVIIHICIYYLWTYHEIHCILQIMFTFTIHTPCMINRKRLPPIAAKNSLSFARFSTHAQTYLRTNNFILLYRVWAGSTYKKIPSQLAVVS
ncbi:hypothetical protein BDR05DRAFT_363082 [Suillus weaverae]|nr:hypothetical protein BDR05DRAFT_363082 [Suillus weaverae]